MSEVFTGKKGKYKLSSKHLGKGNYGDVYECFEESTNEKYAIKVLRQSMEDLSEKAKTEIERETENIKELISENIVCLIDIGQKAKYKFFVFELCESDLDKVKKSINYKTVLVNGVFEEEHMKTMLKYTKHLLNGFKAIFLKNLIHRDIKPSNLLIANGVLKIGDFGFSRIIEDMLVADMYTLKGTPIYASYEILKGLKYSSKCDVFACGLVIFEIFFGTNPYYGDGKGISSVSHLIMLLELGKVIVPPNNLPKNFMDLILGMIKVKEVDRLNWRDIFFKLEDIFGNDPETDEKCVFDSITEIKKLPLLKLINENLLTQKLPKDRLELLEKRMQINSFYQKLIFSLIEDNSLFTQLVKDELILSLNLLYLHILEEDKTFVIKESSQSKEAEKECAVFLEKINKDGDDCQKVIQKMTKIVLDEIKKEKKKSMFNRYFEMILFQNKREASLFAQYISWIILMQRKKLLAMITSETLKIKEGFLLFHLIHSVDHSQIFQKPLTLKEEFNDPSNFRDAVNELSRVEVNSCLEMWLKDL